MTLTELADAVERQEPSRDIRREAEISECGKYRYSLDRKWFPDRFYSPAKAFGHPAPLIFVMLNPSTADAYADDPTIRRCIGFAQREGYEWLKVINLFGGRATKPADLFKMDEPIGSENEKQWLLAKDFALLGAKVVCAWGANPKAQNVARRFFEVMDGIDLWCLGKTKSGAPKHPLYLSKDAPLAALTAASLRAMEEQP